MICDKMKISIKDKMNQKEISEPNKITEMKILSERFKSFHLEQAEETTSKLENMTIKRTKSENRKKKNLKVNRT